MVPSEFPEVQPYNYLKRLLARFNVTVVSAAGETNGNGDAIGELLDKLIGAVHDFDRKRIIERMKAGKVESRKVGRHTDGLPPYGYRQAGSGRDRPLPRAAGQIPGGHVLRRQGDDNGIEVYVLTDSAFTVWQNGYATSSIYESGKVAEGTVQAEIPAGAGIYYLVFSNKSAPKTPKSIHATVLLRYKSWLPDWFRRMKGRFWDWVGSN